MQYTDRIYGSFELSEPALLDLLSCQAVQRLDGVLQHGISALIGLTRATSRLEHSLGVLLLVRQLGGGEREQIAALLHDVSHTAFSHVIDYVFDSHHSQSYHEEVKPDYVAGSDLPDVLARHGYDWHDFLHEDDYPLLEQPAPALCADRLDYFLRDSYDLKLSTLEQIERVRTQLAAHQGRIVCTDLNAARWLGYTFIAADQASWANLREVGLYELTAQAIRRGLEIGVLDMSDLWTTDQVAWDKLCAQGASDPPLANLLRQVSLDTRFWRDEQQPTLRVGTKIRSIDPDVLIGGQLHPLSSLDPDFGAHRRDYHAHSAGKWPLRVLPA